MKKFIAMVTTVALLMGLIPANLVLATGLVDELAPPDLYAEVFEDSALEATVTNATTIQEVSQPEQTVLSILHMNDVHGRFNAGINFARFATIAASYRKNNPNTLVLDAGDAIHGTNFANLFYGASMIELMNLVGVDAMVAGNHEFNYGQDRLLELNAQANFPILGANIFNADGSNFLDPYTIIELEDVTVGIFGLATPTTPTVTSPNNVIGLEFTDPVLRAQEMVDYLAPKVDVVIALTHLGLTGVRGSREVALAVDGIDLIVDGHCHSVRPNGEIVNGTTIAIVGEHAANLGTVEIILEAGEVVSVAASMYTASDLDEQEIAFDQAVLDLISYYMDELEDVLNEQIGYSQRFLNNNYVRHAETALGNLTGDLFLSVTGADVALMNSGGIRDHLHQGDITVGDVFNIFPFGNVIEVYEISGQVLLDALENSVSMFEINNPVQSHGRFPQIAGMSFTIDISQPAGNRISNLLIEGRPVNLAALYTLATSGFVGAGGDGFTMIPAYGRFVGEFGAVDENLSEYIRNHDVIDAQIEGRMLIRDEFGYVRNPDVTQAQLLADNFVIHLDDVTTMDVVSLANATLVLNDDAVEATLQYTVNEITGVGAYQVAFTASYNEELFTEIGEITIFVVDDQVAMSADYVIFGNYEITKPFATRANITTQSLINVGNFEAFRIVDAAVVTSRLTANTADLRNLQTAQTVGVFNVRLNLNPEAVIAVTLVDDLASGNDNQLTGQNPPTLPQTGLTTSTNVILVSITLISSGLALAKSKKSA